MSRVCPVCGSPTAAGAASCASCGAMLPPAPVGPPPIGDAIPQPPAPPAAFVPAEPPPPPALAHAPASLPMPGMQPPSPQPWPAPVAATPVPPPDAASPAPGWPSAAAAKPRRRAPAVLALTAIAGVLIVAIVALALNQNRGAASAAASPSSGGASASAAAIVPAPSSTPAPSASASATPAPSASPNGPVVVKVGISLPMSSDWINVTGRVHDAILLAMKEATPIPGVTIEPYLLDYAASGSANERQSIKDMQTFVADKDVVAVIGPYASGYAYDQIPVGFEAKLLECAPNAGWTGLTKGAAADELRGMPEASTTFLRVRAPDDDQGFAMADYAASTLKLHNVVIVDGGGNIQYQQIADRFAERWAQLAGTSVAGRLKAATGLVAGLKTAAASRPGAVFFAGDEAGAAKVRAAMDTVGLGQLPLLANGTVAFGGADKDYVTLAGKRAANTYVAFSYAYQMPDYDGFAGRFSAAYGNEPSTWSPEAYACTQVVIEAIRQAAAAGNLTREGVRRAATNPAMTFTTLLGPISFNRAGDIVPAPIAIYKSTLAGKDHWLFTKQLYVQAP